MSADAPGTPNTNTTKDSFTTSATNFRDPFKTL